MTDAALLEHLAALEHDQWVSYVRHLFEIDPTFPRRAKWEALCVPYDQLSEDEKEKAREWARHVLALLRGPPRLLTDEE